MTLPHGRDGLSARRMAVLWTFREPSLCRHVHRECMRNAVLDLTPIIPATACHQRNYVERYSRYICSQLPKNSRQKGRASRAIGMTACLFSQVTILPQTSRDLLVHMRPLVLAAPQRGTRACGLNTLLIYIML